MSADAVEDAIEGARNKPPKEAARLLEKAVGRPRPPVERMLRLLHDRKVGDPILEHLPMRVLERLAEECVEGLQAAPHPARATLRSAAWKLLDVVRRRPVLRRIAGGGTVEEWSERLLRLIETSQFSFGRLFVQRVAAGGSRTLFYLPRSRRAMSWREAGERVEGLSRGLLAVTEGAGRPVAILSENRLEVALLDLACLSSGIVNVMIPANATDADVAYILRHAGAGTLVASSRGQLQKALMHRESLPDVRLWVGLDVRPAEVHGVVPFQELLDAAPQVSPDVVPGRRDRIRIDDLAAVMYTSGTTGVPKGIMFSHRNIVFKRFARALALPEIGEEDRFLCYLPLFHTFGRFLELGGCVFWGATYCFADNPGIDTLIRQMDELKPTVFVSIPMKWMQLYEKIRQEVDIEAADDAAVIEVTHKTTGGRLRWGLSAAGYLDPSMFRFFQRGGIELMSGFGMTEATGGITMTPPGRYKDHSLGKALPGIELKLDRGGELKIRGPYVMMGYLDPPEGEASFDHEGWLATGDIMEMDEEGFIRLVDRKKEIYKNIKGQTIAPQRIENLFRDFESVGRIFLVGDHRPYNTALIYPNPDFKDLDLTSLSSEELKAHFRSLVVSANSFVEPFERIVDFAVIVRDFDPDRSELTPKGTYRRKVIERNFADVIRLLYRRRTLAVGGVELTVPNWLFQKLGITTQDISVEGDRLLLASAGTALTIRSASEDLVQVGSMAYRPHRSSLDLGVLLRTPSLWLGNEELVAFASLELRDRDLRRQGGLELEWSGRVAAYDADASDGREMERLLETHHIGLMDLHRVAMVLEAADGTEAVRAVTVLEHVLRSKAGRTRDVARRLLRRGRTSRHVEVLHRAFRTLTLEERPELFPKTLASFLDGAVSPLNLETISFIAARDLSLERLDALIRETERRCLQAAAAGPLETKKALLDLLTQLGGMHPSRYRRLRGSLTRMSMEAGTHELRRYAGRARERLEKEFRDWLGPASRVAVDPETGCEFRWTDVLRFSEDVDAVSRKRLLSAFLTTPMLREAIFLFSGGTLIRLDHILPQSGDVLVRPIGAAHGKIVFRVTVKTLFRGHFDFAVNVNQRLSASEVREEIDWLILCGESSQRAPLAEGFGGYWPEQDLWTEEFISGETLDKALRRLATQARDRERVFSFWPYAAWSGLSAQVDLWRRTGQADPSPSNVIVPLHDYHSGARLVSIAGRRPVVSLYELLWALKQELVAPIEQEHPALEGVVGWDILFSSVLETLGEREGLRVLESARQEAGAGGEDDMRAGLEHFSTAIKERGFRPLRVYFAAKRYRRWARLNPEATLAARARTLQEIYETYSLGLLQDAYPEVRARFFQDTVFRGRPGPLSEGLSQIIGRLRQRQLTPDELSFAVADLRAQVRLEPEEEYFLARLSYPYLRPEDEAEFVPTEVGGGGQSEMVVTLDDRQGNPYRIRHALSAKEVGRLHGLFLSAKLRVHFRPDHRFLVAVSERGHLIGGLFYEVELEARTAHMDKVVVADRFQGRGIAGALLEELSNRLRTAGYRSLTTGFFRPQFFYRYGFTVDKNHAGLVRALEQAPGEGI